MMPVEAPSQQRRQAAPEPAWASHIVHGVPERLYGPPRDHLPVIIGLASAWDRI
jgi:hypothetical protein